jgi:hypothetical protein
MISRPQDARREIAQQAAVALVGADKLLDVRFPNPSQIPEPRNDAERAALVEVVRAIDQLQHAIEAYQVALGTWHGKPKLAIAWSTPPASGTDQQENSGQ